MAAMSASRRLVAFCLAASCARALLPVRGARAGALREGGAPGAGRAGRRRPGPRMTMAVARGGSRAAGFGAGGAAPFWGVFGVTAMLLNAVRRCAPVALEPFSAAEPLTAALVCAYGAAAASMAYAEGYKAFHLKFSPMVVKRSLTLRDAPLAHKLAGPLYAMGLFHATKKRACTSWGFLVGVFGLVKLVQRLPYPWRSVVDAGVVAGLGVGAGSILYHYARCLLYTSPSPRDRTRSRMPSSA